MKKKITSILSCLLAGCSAFMVACGGDTPGGDDSTSDIQQIVDKTKTQIVMYSFAGGYGSRQWLELAEEWNATNDKYQIIVDPNKDEWYTYEAALKAGTSRHDIYMGQPTLSTATLGYLEDLTPLVDMDVKGEDYTIGSIMKNKATLDKSMTTKEGNYFALPIYNGISGFIFDYQIFLDKGFLIGKDGNLTKDAANVSAGRDGVEGTVDDGQPVNMTEWNKMITAIKDSGMYTFLYTKKFSYYTEPLLGQLFYDYIGDANTKTFTTLEGSYTNPKTNDSFELTVETGYRRYEMAGYLESLQFIDNYVADPLYYHPSAAKTGTSHTDAQKLFVYGNAFDGATTDKQVAFLYEGNWWENEAIANFNSLEKRGMSDYAFGTRDYRYLVLPKLDDKGVYDSLPLTSFSDEAIAVKKQTDENKKAAIFDFLTFLFRNENLVKIATYSGGYMPYEITFSAEQEANLTKFVQNMYALANTNNAKSRMTTYPENKYQLRQIDAVYYNGSGATYPVDAFQRGAGLSTLCNAQQGYEGLLAYTKANWTEKLLAKFD